jgi:O-antigen ligase
VIYQAPIFAVIAFWTLSVGIFVLDLKWSVIAYLLLTQFDLSGPEFASTSAVGYENAIKLIVLPVVLLWRVGWGPVRRFGAPTLARIWAGLLGYALISTLWSPFQLSALKMVGYLFCYAVLFVVFSVAWSAKWLSEWTLSVLALSCFGIGVIQTYVLGNDFGTTEDRFTTFADPQGYAVFSISMLSLLFFCGAKKLWSYLTMAVLVIGIVLTGSRYVFVAAILLFLVGSILRLSKRKSSIDIRIILKGATVGLIVALLLVGLLTHIVPSNRIDELIVFAAARDSTVEDIGTLAWRFEVYQETINQLSNRNLWRLAIGSGTSSGGNVLLALGPKYEDALDANRSIHNEFLRVFYEWGIAGCLLLVFLVAEILKQAWSAYRAHRSWQSMAVLGIFPAVFFSFATENILSAAGRPGGTGYVLVFAALFASISHASEAAVGRQTAWTPS